MPQDRPVPGSSKDWMARAKGMNIPQEVEEASILTNFAWETRYPGVHEPVTREEYQEALHQAEQVLAWAEQIISG